MDDFQSVVFGYNLALPESRDLAEYYLAKIGAPASRAVGLDCSTQPILSSYQEFRDTVETPLRNFGRNGVSAYVLGYRVPVGFAYNGGFISACSRMSSPYPLSPRIENPVFNASGGVRSSVLKDEGIVPCSSIDMPTISASRQIASYAQVNALGVLVDGELLLDPNPPAGESSLYLSAAFEEFESGLAGDIFPNYRRSVLQNAPYDSSFPYATGDSFFFGWGLHEANESYFLPHGSKRAIFFNADSGSLSRIRPADSGFSTCVSAISSGYAFAIGRVGEPPRDSDDPYAVVDGLGGAPHPTPMFMSVVNREAVGEAWALASPQLDTPFGCIGCPFAKFGISATIDSSKMPAAESARETQTSLSRVVAWIHHKAEQAEALQSRLYNWSDRLLALRTLPIVEPVTADHGIESSKGALSSLLSSYYQFITQVGYGVIRSNEPSLLEFMEATNNKISVSLADYSLGGVQWLKDMQYTTFEKPGSWTTEFKIEEMDRRLGFMHFQAEVVDESGLLVETIKSYSSNDAYRWEYETHAGRMGSIPAVGVFSGRVGARVRISSPNSGSPLRRSEAITIRVRQIIDMNLASEWREIKTVTTS
jgi:hypothetical protein